MSEKNAWANRAGACRSSEKGVRTNRSRVPKSVATSALLRPASAERLRVRLRRRPSHMQVVELVPHVHPTGRFLDHAVVVRRSRAQAPHRLSARLARQRWHRTKKAHSEAGFFFTANSWRRGRESNPSKRLCRPLHNLFATSPEGLLAHQKRKPSSFPQNSGAEEESRTLDLNLGKVALYQLSYFRIGTTIYRQLHQPVFTGAEEESRTLDLNLGKVALYQLSYFRIGHCYLPPTTPTSIHWSGRRVSNSRPQPWQGCALPTELLPH